MRTVESASTCASAQNRRSSLKERGRSRGLAGPFSCLRPRFRTPPLCGASCSGCRGRAVSFSPGCRVSMGVVDAARINAGFRFRGWEQARWLLGHPFAAPCRGGMMGCAESSRSGSIRTVDLAVAPQELGGHDQHGLATDRRARASAWSCRGARTVQRSDVMVTQRVEHVLEVLASGCDHPDVAAPPLPDAVADGTDPAGLGEDLDRLVRGPADQPGPLLW